MSKIKSRVKKLAATSLSASFLTACGFIGGGYANEVSGVDIIDVNSAPFSWESIAPGGGRLISFQYILDTGEVPGDTILGSPKLYDVFFSALSSFSSPLEYNNYYIDWDADDAFTRAVSEIKASTYARIQNDRILWGLVNKPEWDRDDRIKWEKNVSKIIAQEVSAIEGLNSYRTTGPSGTEDTKVEVRSRRLNQVSSDIEMMKQDTEGNIKPQVELDCEGLSIVVGAILQMVDNQFLPEAAPEGNYKEATAYYYVLGKMNVSAFNNTLGRHAFIFSPSTGSVIEATDIVLGTIYVGNMDAEYGLENLRQGDIIETETGYIYTSRNANISDVAAIRMERNELDISGLYARISPQWHNGDMAVITEDECKTFEVPPELAQLSYLKWRALRLENEQTNMSEQQRKTAEQLISHFQKKFEERVEENIQNGNIYNILRFLNEFDMFSKDDEVVMIPASFADAGSPQPAV